MDPIPPEVKPRRDLFRVSFSVDEGRDVATIGSMTANENTAKTFHVRIEVRQHGRIVHTDEVRGTRGWIQSWARATANRWPVAERVSIVEL